VKDEQASRGGDNLREADDDKPSAPSVAYIKKELLRYRDPVRLGDHVLRTLQMGDYEKAYSLTEIATRNNIKAVVSWNHLINYEMKLGRVAGSLKIYNAVCGPLFVALSIMDE
jgi:hypothetical protein